MNIFEVLAHEGEEVVEQLKPTIDEVIRGNSIQYSLISLGIFAVLVVLSIIFKDKSEKIKYLLFGAFVLVAVANTVYLTGSTIYLNQVSLTSGPVHWHADFEIYNCGQKVEIEDPRGFSNKVGTQVIHEHNDDRIHIEGVILDKHDASLGHFIEQIGGQLHKDHMAIPTEDGLLELENGQNCPDGQKGVLQVFVYVTSDHTFSQQKLTDPQDYVISPSGQVPPGDCIIIEFGSLREKTDKLCTFYQVAKEKGELIEE